LLGNRSFWGSGRPRAAQEPFKKVGGVAPYLFKGFLEPRGPFKETRRVLNSPGLFLKSPGVFLEGPGVLLKSPGVLLKRPGGF